MKKGLYGLVALGLLLALPLGAGWWAVNVLRFQHLSGCQSLAEAEDQADDAAAVSFYCAQESAGQQTVEGLSEAIRMARLVPPEHPLAAQSDRLVEQASQSLLALAEASFQGGSLEEAIDAARRIPVLTAAIKQRMRGLSHGKLPGIRHSLLIVMPKPLLNATNGIKPLLKQESCGS
jgi:hypothetical protein